MAYAATLYHPETNSTVTDAFIRDTEAEARAAALDSHASEYSPWAETPEEAQKAVKDDLDSGNLVVIIAAVQFG